jgi:hypothetical protein
MELNSRLNRRYESFKPSDLNADKKAGAADGRRGEPNSGAGDFSANEQLIINDVRGDLSTYQREYLRVRTAIDRKILEKQEEFDSYASKRDIINRSDTNKSAIDFEEFAKSDPDYNAANNDYKKIEEEYNCLRDQIERPLQSYIGKLWYRTIFVILSIAEYPINISASLQVFQDSLINAVIVNFVIGFALVFLAHVTGQAFSELFNKDLKKKWQKPRKIIIIVICLLLAFIVMAAVYYMRYMAISTNDDILDKEATALFYLAVNLAVFVIEFIASLFYHDPEPDYQNLARKLDAAQKELVKQHKILSQRLDEESTDHEAATLGLIRRTDRAAIEKRDLENTRASLKNSRDSFINLVLDVLGRRLSAYQEANLSARSAPFTQPRNFGPGPIQELCKKLRKEFTEDKP